MEPNFWNYVPVSSIAKIYLGGTPSRSNQDYWGGDIKWASAKDIAASDSRYIFDAQETITQAGLDNSAAKLMNKETIVITARGTVGAIRILGRPMSFNQTCYGLVAYNTIVPTFLYYALKAGMEDIKSLSYGTVFDTITTKTFESLLIPLPPLPEQRAIADVLGSLDDKIELNRRMNATLEAMASALFKRWFVDNEEAKGWEVGKLGDVVAINEQSMTKNYPHGTIEYIDISSVNIGHLEGTTTYSLEDSPSRAKRLVKHGDTIWSTVRPNRKSYLFINNPKNNIVVSTGFAVLTPKKIPPSYLYFWVTRDQFIDYLVSNADGSAYPAVLPERFTEAEMLIPPKYIVDDFEKNVGPMLTRIAYNEEESRILASLRDALLPRLMRGEVRVKDIA